MSQNRSRLDRKSAEGAGEPWTERGAAVSAVIFFVGRRSDRCLHLEDTILAQRALKPLWINMFREINLPTEFTGNIFTFPCFLVFGVNDQFVFLCANINLIWTELTHVETYSEFFVTFTVFQVDLLRFSSHKATSSIGGLRDVFPCHW